MVPPVQFAPPSVVRWMTAAPPDSELVIDLIAAAYTVFGACGSIARRISMPPSPAIWNAQLRPPSTDLNMRSPTDAYNVAELTGLMTIECTRPAGRPTFAGCHDAPPSVVLNTPAVVPA